MSNGAGRICWSLVFRKYMDKDNMNCLNYSKWYAQEAKKNFQGTNVTWIRSLLSSIWWWGSTSKNNGGTWNNNNRKVEKTNTVLAWYPIKRPMARKYYNQYKLFIFSFSILMCVFTIFSPVTLRCVCVFFFVRGAGSMEGDAVRVLWLCVCILRHG